MKERIITNIDLEIENLKLVDVSFTSGKNKYKNYIFIYPFGEPRNGEYVLVQDMINDDKIYSLARITYVYPDDVKLHHLQAHAFVQGSFFKVDIGSDKEQHNVVIEDFDVEMKKNDKIVDSNFMDYILENINEYAKTENKSPKIYFKSKSQNIFKKHKIFLNPYTSLNKNHLYLKLITKDKIETLEFEECFLKDDDIISNKNRIFFPYKFYSILPNKLYSDTSYIVSKDHLSVNDIVLTKNDIFHLISEEIEIKYLDTVFGPDNSNLLNTVEILNDSFIKFHANGGYNYCKIPSRNSRYVYSFDEVLNILLHEDYDSLEVKFEGIENMFKFSLEKNKINKALLSFVNKDNKEVVIYVERI